MYRLIRVDKRIPDGSIWQARRGYLLDAIRGWTRVFGPTGTRWSNPLGGWTAQHEGVSLFHPERPFTISCHGPAAAKRFYVDIAHRVRITPDLVEFVDLFLDVMIDGGRGVSEKDEHQLAVLSPELQAFARSARDQVRGLIEARDGLFDAASDYYAIPAGATSLHPPTAPIAL
jgi:Protein of unknown function (DUF402)